MTIEVKKETVETKTEEKKVLPSVEDMQKELEKLRNHNSTLKGEKNDFKSKYETMKGDVESKRQDELTQKEDYKTMLEEANSKITNLEDTLTRKEENALSKSIAFEVQKLAGDAIDISDVMEKINVSEENIDMESQSLTDIAEQVDNIRKSKPYLFKKKNNSMTTKLPNSVGVTSNADKGKSLKRRVAEQLLK